MTPGPEVALPAGPAPDASDAAVALASPAAAPASAAAEAAGAADLPVPRFLPQLGVLFSRELASFFFAPVSYLVWVVFLLASGYLFATSIRNGGPASIDRVFSNMGMLLLFVAPLLTMRLVAEEQKLGTLEVLLTDPVGEATVILAKFAAVTVFFAIVLAPTLCYPAILAAVGEPDPGPIVAAYAGLLLLGALFLSIGLLASALIDSQVAAAATSFTILLVFWLLGRAAQTLAPGPTQDALEYLSAFARYEPFRRGLLDTRTVVYCASLTGLSLFLATRALGRRRA